MNEMLLIPTRATLQISSMQANKILEQTQPWKTNLELHTPDCTHTGNSWPLSFTMEPRRQHQIDLCGTQNATISNYVNNKTNHADPKGPFCPALVCHIPPDDAQRLAQDRSTRIFASYHQLRAIIERHELTIQRRWTKKTKTQLQTILLKAWPNSKYHYFNQHLSRVPLLARVACWDAGSGIL